LAGESSFKPARWVNDSLSDLWNDDALWAYMIRASKEVQIQDWSIVRDPVLHCPMKMGIFDWEGTDKSLNQTVPVIRFSTALDT